MGAMHDGDIPGTARAGRKRRAAGVIIAVLGAILLVRGLYDYHEGNAGTQEVFMLGVSALIIVLGLYRALGSGPSLRR